MRKSLNIGLLTLGLLGSTAAYSQDTLKESSERIFSEWKIKSGIISGRMPKTDSVQYDSSSNNYAVFIITRDRGEYMTFPYNSLKLYSLPDNSSVCILCRDVFEGKNYSGLEVKTVMNREECLKKLMPNYKLDLGL